MIDYKNFKATAYVHAEYLYQTALEDVDRGIHYFQQYIPLKKVYLETHRGLYDVPKDKMTQIIEKFKNAGIEVSGGITSTITIPGHEKNSVFDVFCFTDPVYREKYLEIVKDTASQFDEIILDDFFFTACRCEMCIKEKGRKTWAQFRLDQMEEFAKEIVGYAKKINPKCRFVIKYPNWYESYQECGYNPEKQKDIFDAIYTGTESRDPRYSQQHLQRYLSYSLVRLMENIAPGRKGGGWVDQGGSWDNLNVWLEQFYLTALAGAKELMMFNFHELIGSPALPPLGQQLYRFDQFLSEAGNPIGTVVYEPYNGTGDDQLMNYLGMIGLPLEPKPEFDQDAPAMLLTASSACDNQVIPKLEYYIRAGGTAIITTGFLRATYDRGIQEMTSVRLTGRKVSGKEYWLDSYYLNHKDYCSASENIGIDILEYKTNASWCEIALVSGDCNFPVLVDEFYGDGHLYVLNIPDNFSDLYYLPEKVVANIGKVFSKDQRVYLSAEPKHNLFPYDNDVFAVASYRPHEEDLDIIVRGEDVTGIQDLESGEMFSISRAGLRPVKRFDSAKTTDECQENVITVPVTNGAFRFFRFVKNKRSSKLSYAGSNPGEIKQ